jgi:hypothetical protein
MNKIAVVALASPAFVLMKAECQALASTPPLQTIPLPGVTSHLASAAGGISVPSVHRYFAGVPQH